MGTRVLVLDDDQKLNDLLKNYLSGFGFEVRGVRAPSDAESVLKCWNPEILILDYMLPEKSGLEFLRELRARGVQVPVLMLTARGDPHDRILGLETGADDYLPKPFEPRELVARIEAILRRQRAARSPEPDCLASGDLVLDRRRREVRLESKDLGFSSAEFDLLWDLMLHAGSARNRDEILDQTKGMNPELFTRTIDVTLSRVRQKLGDDPKKPRYIRTLYGSGYLFIPSVERK